MSVSTLTKMLCSEIEFWSGVTEGVYIELALELVEDCGYTEEDAVSFLKCAYQAADQEWVEGMEEGCVGEEE